MTFQKEEKLFYTAVYIRLSRDDGDKEESDSVGNQRKLLTEYLAGKNEFALYEIYIDDGYTGTNFDRPGFRRMIGDIEAGRVNCVVVKDLSRFGRDYIDTGRYLERYFPEKDVRFISVTDRIDSMTQAYDLLLPIQNIFNEQYARDISRKIQSTIRSKQMAGEFIGAFASYGYRKSPADKNKLLIDEYAAEIIRRIFSLYIQGYGKQKIAKILNEEGVLCPSEYKRVNGENYRNSNRLESTSYWTYSTINSILHREMYAGNMVQGTKHQSMRGRQKRVSKEHQIIVKNTHEPIIDKETWEKTQSLLTKRTREPDPQSAKTIFAGLVKCGDCGRAMTKSMRRRTDGSETYCLCCGTYKRHGKAFCTPHRIPGEVLEKTVSGDLKIILEHTRGFIESTRTPEHTRGFTESTWTPKHTRGFTESGRTPEHARGFTESTQTPEHTCGFTESTRTPEHTRGFTESAALQGGDTDMRLKKLSAELDRIKRLKKSVYEDYREGLISREEFLSYRKDYLKKEDLCSRQLLAVKETCAQKETEDRPELPWLKKLSEWNGSEIPDREIVTEMISEIRIYEDQRIKIIYKFSNDSALPFPVHIRC